MYSETHISFLILLFHYIKGRDFRRNPTTSQRVGVYWERNISFIVCIYTISKECLQNIVLKNNTLYEILFKRNSHYTRSCTNIFIYVGITRIRKILLQFSRGINNYTIVAWNLLNLNYFKTRSESFR